MTNYNITPVLGSNLLQNGGFELGNINNWSHYENTFDSSSATFTVDNSVKNSGNYSGKYDITNGGNTNQSDCQVWQQELSVTSGIWYSVSLTAKASSSLNNSLLTTIHQNSPYENIGLSNTINIGTSFATLINTFRSSISYTNQARLNLAFGNQGADTIWIDDLAFQAMTLSSLFGYTTDGLGLYTIESIDWTIVQGTQAGLVLNLDSVNDPKNFILVYISNSYLIIDKCIAGVYTNISSTAITYVAGAKLKVVNNSLGYTAFYNSSAITAFSVIDAEIINNTINGAFSTCAQNTFTIDELSIPAYPVNMLPASNIKDNVILDINVINNTNAGFDANASGVANSAVLYSKVAHLYDGVLINPEEQNFFGAGTKDDPYYLLLSGNTQLSIPHSDKLNFVNNFSIEFNFIPLQDLNYSLVHGVDSFNFSAGKANAWTIGWNSQLSQLRFGFYNPYINASDALYKTNLKAGKLYRYTITNDGTNFKHYINGNYCYMPTWLHLNNMVKNSNPIVISVANGCSIKFLSLRIYNIALSDSDVFYTKNIVEIPRLSNFTLGVTNNIIKNLPEKYNFVGANVGIDAFWSQNSPISTLRSRNQLEGLFAFSKKYRINHLRYPSGLYCAYLFWDVAWINNFNALNNWNASELSAHNYYPVDMRTRNNPDNFLNITEFLNFCKANLIKVTMQLNTHTYYDHSTGVISKIKPDRWLTPTTKDPFNGTVDWTKAQYMANYAARFVQWTKDNGYFDTIEYWEIGNEEYAGTLCNSQYRGAEYARLCDMFIQSIRTVDVNVKFIIASIFYDDSLTPNNTTQSSRPLDDASIYGCQQWYNKWTNDLLTSSYFAKYLNDSNIALSRHPYSGQVSYPYGQSDFASIDAMKLCVYRSLFDNIKTQSEVQNKIFDNIGFVGNIIANEFNLSSSDYGCTHLANYLAALANAVQILSALNSRNYIHMDFFGLKETAPNFGVTFGKNDYACALYTNQISQIFTMIPTGEIIKFVNEHISNNVLEVSNNSDNCIITASKYGDYLNILILSMINNNQITLTLSGFDDYELNVVKSFGIGLDPDFTVLNRGDTVQNPTVIREMPIAFNQIEITGSNGVYNFTLPVDTLHCLQFIKKV